MSALDSHRFHYFLFILTPDTVVEGVEGGREVRECGPSAQHRPLALCEVMLAGELTIP